MTQLASIVPAGYFGQTAPIRRPLGSSPLLQWFNGLPAGKRLATGWHIQASRCDESLTAALKAIGTERVTVLHRMSGEMVEYWSLETCSLVLLCNGFADPWEMRQTGEREGVAYGWISSKNSSKVKARVLIAELVEAGYTEQLTITLEGMITESFFEALSQQFRVLDAFEKLTGVAAPFYGFSIPMTPADKPRMVGTKKGKQSPIIPMVVAVPQRIDEEYLSAHLCPKALLDLIVSRDLVGKAVRWSIDTSERISRGEDKEAWETVDDEEAVSTGKETAAAQSTPKEMQDQGSGAVLPASVAQITSIGKLCQRLNKPMPTEPLSFEQAKRLLVQLSSEYNQSRHGRGK